MADETKKEKPTEKVWYRVLSTVFVNNTYTDIKAANPIGATKGGDGAYYVFAPAGLESKGVLELAPGGPPPGKKA